MAAFMRAMAAGMAAAPREEDGVLPPSSSSSTAAAAPPSRAAVTRRVAALTDAITRAVYAHVTGGLIERHRLPCAAALATAVAAKRGDAAPAKLAFLVAPHAPPAPPPPHPGHAWLTDAVWRALVAARDGASDLVREHIDWALSP